MKMKKNSPVYSRFYIYTCVCVRNELRTPTNIFVNEYIRAGVLRKKFEESGLSFFKEVRARRGDVLQEIEESG